MQVGYLNVSDHGDIKNIHSKSFSLGFCVCKNIAACLFSVVNVISLHVINKLCLIRLRFKRNSPFITENISRNVVSLNILARNVISVYYRFLYLLSFLALVMYILDLIHRLLQLLTYHA